MAHKAPVFQVYMTFESEADMQLTADAAERFLRSTLSDEHIGIGSVRRVGYRQVEDEDERHD